ncbi:MAG: hypothetical protein ACI3XC_05750, partial [Phascolarctobacterium sp.]
AKAWPLLFVTDSDKQKTAVRSRLSPPNDSCGHAKAWPLLFVTDSDKQKTASSSLLISTTCKPASELRFGAFLFCGCNHSRGQWLQFGCNHCQYFA